MKSVKIETRVACLELLCPLTQEAISGPASGSHLWDRVDCETAVDAGYVKCHACEGASHPVPAAVKRLAR